MIHEFVDAMDLREQQWFCDAWHLCARRNQRPKLSNWRTWLLLGGRGSGKTRTGAEWIKGLIAKNGLYSGDAAGRVALVGSSYAEVRDVMIEGESGLLQIYTRTDRPTWLSSRRRLEWSDGTVGLAFSSADPEQLRGNQFGAAWCDAKTIWGSLLAVCAALASTIGISVDEVTQQGIADALVQLIGAFGALTAIYGRITATDVIS